MIPTKLCIFLTNIFKNDFGKQENNLELIEEVYMITGEDCVLLLS